MSEEENTKSSKAGNPRFARWVSVRSGVLAAAACLLLFTQAISCGAEDASSGAEGRDGEPKDGGPQPAAVGLTQRGALEAEGVPPIRIEPLPPPTPDEIARIASEVAGGTDLPWMPNATLDRDFEPQSVQGPKPGFTMSNNDPLSPGMGVKFLALLSNGAATPPDTGGAAGPNHLLVTSNTEVRIQNKAGGILSTQSLSAFLAAAGGTGHFDPKSFYDPMSGRYVVVALADKRSAASAIVLRVSQTNDPTGAWYNYRYDGDATDVAWLDYPSIGFNKNWIIVGVNRYSVANDSSLGVKVYNFPKANMYSGSGTGVGSWTLASGHPQTIVPAVTHDSATSRIHLLASLNAHQLRLYYIDGAVGSEQLFTPAIYPTSPDYWATSPPVDNFAPQADTTAKVHTGDDRIQNVVYRNGSLWTTHTIFLPSGAATRSAVQWWQIQPSDGAVLQRGLVDDSTGARFFAYPTLAVNRDDSVLLGFSRFGASHYPSADYVFRNAGDAPNTMQSISTLKGGETWYQILDSKGRNRWGDFSHTMVDPVNDSDMWTIQEYAALSGTSGIWALYWGKITDACFGVVCSAPCAACKNGACVAAKTGTECRASAGPCDVAEACDGLSTACPINQFAPSSTACRASAGVCDPAENCTGSAATCPVDQVSPSGTVCRASTGVCDPSETCNGVAVTCPANQYWVQTPLCIGIGAKYLLIQQVNGSTGPSS